MGYSMKQKIDICLMSEANPSMTQTDLAQWAKTRFNSTKPPSQTTISRILAKKDALISLKEHEYKLIRRRRLSNTLLRKVLLEWITQCVWNNIPITSPIILSSAANFWKQLPETMKDGTGEFSFKWCSQFLSRVNINLSTIDRDLYANRLHVWTFEERENLKSLFTGVDPSKIFTVQEMLISHDLPLDKALYHDSSDFLTCMLCTNVDGSERLDPLIIGRYEDYPSFESKSSMKAATKHGVSYRSNRKKWLTSTVFYDWLCVLDKRLALVQKDIILVLDDTASHRVVNIKLQRIRLLYTSSNSNFLPMAWGVENDLRLNFRIAQYEKLRQKQVSLRDKILSDQELHFTMADTFDLIKVAWANLPASRIKSAWKQSGILPDSITQSFGKVRMFDDTLETKLVDAIDSLVVQEKWDVLSLMDLSIEKKINKTFLSNQEIIESCIVDNYDDFDHSTGKQLRAPFSHTLGQEFQPLRRFGQVRRKYGYYSNGSTPTDSTSPRIPSDYWDLDNFQFDGNMADFYMLGNEPSPAQAQAPVTQVQLMSELAPSAQTWGTFAPNTQPYMAQPLESSSLTPADIRFGLNNLEFGVTSDAMLSPTQMISNEEKLEIIHNFMNLVESDRSLLLSKSAKNEINDLYQRLLHDITSHPSV
ncbi:PDC2 [Cyberlindnera jadinii]|uniref:PDC2 protein n=1 Tax=Cyberlindnera jadinii (strain ATCC 18201 / CBS 1600 / BCRC 20928 / JCM 3617 / NBRC 0987 / NRRL Y-1542) TaxID=983966 RepID=A0A0H5C4R4_CYBJN|nr:PDC2 [Cyberlindnera jadinii]